LTNAEKVNQSGTYWYHSHDYGQYPDGLWGPLIVHDEQAIAPYHVDEEVIVTLTDWYHDEMAVLSKQYQSQLNTQDNAGREPVPEVALINGSPNAKIYVKPNKTYLFRIICVGNWPGHAFLFDQHDMKIVEVDGVWMDPVQANFRNVRIATGQRMSVILQTKNTTNTNYAIWDTMDINMMFFNEGRVPTPGYNSNVTAHLVYDDDAPLPPAPVLHEFDFIDDVDFRPADKEPLMGPVTHHLTFDMYATTNSGLPKYSMNGATYTGPTTPSLYTAASDPYNTSAYGGAVPIILPYGAIVQVAVNNNIDPVGKSNLHPFHLHGHTFQVLQRTQPNQGAFNGTLFANVSSTPIKRDTIMVQNGGHAVLRFRADNPGTWLFHCHIEWHVEAGLMATFIEAPERLRHLHVPSHQKELCKLGAGNGNGGGVEHTAAATNGSTSATSTSVATVGASSASTTTGGSTRTRTGRTSVSSLTETREYTMAPASTSTSTSSS
jgi:iron transport multicopper oxidase